MMKGARAIVALTFPEPGCLGSSYQDCVDIFSEQQSCPTESQMTLRTAADKYTEWRRRIAVFWSEAADDCSVAPSYTARAEDWSVDAKVSTELVKATAADITSWKKKLRPGGCDTLIGKMIAFVKSAWAKVAEDGESDIDTDILRTCVEALAKICTDPTVASIRKSLLTKSAAAAKDSALAKFLDLVGNFRPDHDVNTLISLEEAVLIVEGIPKSTEMKQAMHNFRGFMCTCLANRLPLVSRGTDGDKKVLQAARSMATMFAAELTGPEYISDKADKFLNAYRLASDVKHAAAELAQDLDDGGSGAILLPKYYAAMKEWTLYADSHRQGNFSIDTMRTTMTEYISTVATKFTEAAASCLQTTLAECARAKGRLDKVAGGCDNGKSWKAGLEGEVALSSDRMETACKVVAQAYCTAIDTRIAELQKASWQMHLHRSPASAR